MLEEPRWFGKQICAFPGASSLATLKMAKSGLVSTLTGQYNARLP